MADIELELLSRAILVGGIADLISAQIEARLFFDPEARAVFETCVDHYRTWQHPLSLEGIKRRHPDFRVVASSDELGYLISEFREDRSVKAVISHLLDMNRNAEQAESGDREMRRKLPDLFIEAARAAAAEVPLQNVERFSDMDRRMEEIRAQQN